MKCEGRHQEIGKRCSCWQAAPVAIVACREKWELKVGLEDTVERCKQSKDADHDDDNDDIDDYNYDDNDNDNNGQQR